MSWLSLTVDADAAVADRLGEALLELGALSVDIRDADAGTDSEQALFGEPGEDTSTVWARNSVTALFPEDAPVEAILRSAAEAAGLPNAPHHRVETLADNDWVRLTQSQFEPICISQHLWIVPTWHEPPDPEAINITLDPGLAFGTGGHPTTRLCLKWLDDHIHGGEMVLDYGCGSGLLAIAALKLGASSATGTDLDEQAVQASCDNAAANHVAAEFYLPDDLPQRQFDVVVANILTNPLVLLAPVIAGYVRRGGQLALSGILSSQADEVMQAYGKWFDFASTDIEDGWVCLSGMKR